MYIGRLTRKALALGVGRGASVAALFILNIALVRWWTQEEFGQFHQVRLVLSLAALLDLGLPVGLLQATSGMEPDRREEVFRRGVFLSLAVGILTGTGFLVASLLVGNPAIASALPLAGLIIGATIPSAALESVLIVREQHIRASVIGGLSAVGGLVLSVFVLFQHPTLAAVYGALALAALSRLAALWWKSGIRLPAARPAEGSIWSLVGTSLAVSANRLLGMASGSVDRVVIAMFFSAATLGWYVTGAWEVPFMSVFFGAVSSAILPEMSEHWAAGRRTDFLALWKGAATRAAWIVFPLWLWSWVWAPELLRVLFTVAYEDGLPVFRTYLLMLPLRVAIYSTLFIAMNETRLLLVGAALDLVLNLGLSVLLAPLVGPLGPAIAATAVTWVQAAFYLTVARQKVGVSFRAIMSWGDLARALVVATVAVLPTIVVRSWVDSDLARLGLALVFTAGVAFLFIVRTVGNPFGRGRALNR